MKGPFELKPAAHPAHNGINAYAAAFGAHAPGPVDYKALCDFASDLMDSISSACNSAGAADIGHIKAYLDYGSGYLYADSVGYPSDINLNGKDGGTFREARVTVNSVVMGLAQDAIERATEDAIDGALARHGLKRLLIPETKERK